MRPYYFRFNFIWLYIYGDIYMQIQILNKPNFLIIHLQLDLSYVSFEDLFQHLWSRYIRKHFNFLFHCTGRFVVSFVKASASGSMAHSWSLFLIHSKSAGFGKSGFVSKAFSHINAPLYIDLVVCCNKIAFTRRNSFCLFPFCAKRCSLASSRVLALLVLSSDL